MHGSFGTNRTTLTVTQANCFSVHFNGHNEGIKVALRNPQRNVPSLFVGSYYLPVKFGGEGCTVKVKPGVAFGTVRRLEIVSIGSEGRMRVLAEPRSGFQSFYIFADLRLPDNIRMKESLRVYTGVSGGELIAQNGFEALVKVDPNQAIFFYYPDGSVHGYLVKNGKLMNVPLSIQEQADARFTLIWNALNEQPRGNEDPEHHLRRIDGVLHGCINLIRLGQNHPDLQTIGVEILCEAAKNGQLRQGVSIHAQQVLAEVGTIDQRDLFAQAILPTPRKTGKTDRDRANGVLARRAQNHLKRADENRRRADPQKKRD